MKESLFEVFSVAVTALGLSYLIQARAWATLYVEWEVHPERILPTGFLMVIGGLFLAIVVNDGSDTWPLFITAFGWLMALEGALMTLKPSAISSFTRLLGPHVIRYVRFGGFLVLGLGCLLCWEYLIGKYF